MNREQATHTLARVTIDAEHPGLWSIGEVGTGHRRLVLLGIGSRQGDSVYDSAFRR
jgi:hypothetical protein